MKRKILIDCDPGIDDAVALLMASRWKTAEIAAVTVCFGNSSLEHTFKNAEKITELLGIPVHPVKGAAEPMIKAAQNYCSGFHGEDGMGDGLLPEKTEKSGRGQHPHAWDVIYQKAEEADGQLEIITLGPLTNLAIALLRYEDLYRKIKSVTMMGGSCGIGNETAFGEANVLRDAYACEVVFRSGIERIVMVGLDATEQTRFSEAEYREVFQNHGGITAAYQPLLEFYKNKQAEAGEQGLVIHDAAAAAAALCPEIAEYGSYHGEVELDQNGEYGRTIIDKRLHDKREKNITVVEKIDKSKYKELLMNIWNEV